MVPNLASPHAEMMTACDSTSAKSPMIHQWRGDARSMIAVASMETAAPTAENAPPKRPGMAMPARPIERIDAMPTPRILANARMPAACVNVKARCIADRVTVAI